MNQDNTVADIVFAPSRASPMPPGKTLAVTLKFNLPLAYLEAYWTTGSKLEWACAEVQACALAGSLAKELVQQLALEGLPTPGPSDPEERRARQMAMADEILDRYEPALRELAAR